MEFVSRCPKILENSPENSWASGGTVVQYSTVVVGNNDGYCGTPWNISWDGRSVGTDHYKHLKCCLIKHQRQRDSWIGRVKKGHFKHQRHGHIMGNFFWEFQDPKMVVR